MSNSRILLQPFSAVVLSLVLAAPAMSETVASEVTTVNVPEVITFDDAIDGLPFYNFDSSDTDDLTDVVFSTTDPSGFFTFGPGPEQLYIDEPGLEGTTTLDVDLRVDFLQGAVGQIGFGFALISDGSATFTAYNEAGVAVGSQTISGGYFDLGNGGGGVDGVDGGGIDDMVGGGFSLFPENEVIVPLSGTAVYGEFNFEIGGGEEDGGRYIIDNFSFTPAGEDIISTVGGALPENPILPGDIVVDDNGVPEFQFDFNIDENGLGGEFPIFIDPVVAVGYQYTSTVPVVGVLIPGPLPNGDDSFRLVLPGVGEFTLSAGVFFDVNSVVAGGVTAFTIDGIDVSEMLDPNDVNAFVTGLTFLGSGQISTTMTPISANAPGVPEPGPWMLMVLGLVGLYRAAGRRVS